MLNTCIEKISDISEQSWAVHIDIRKPSIHVLELESKGVYWLRTGEQAYVLVYLPMHQIRQVRSIAYESSFTMEGNIAYINSIACMKFVAAPGVPVILPIENIVSFMYPATVDEVHTVLRSIRSSTKHEGQLHSFLRHMKNRLEKY